MMEQELNGKALEDLCISKHFTLKALWHDKEDAVAAFRSCINGYFAGTNAIADESTLTRVLGDVAQEKGMAAFIERLADLSSDYMNVDSATSSE